MPQSKFTRAEIYRIRDLAASGMSAPRIRQAVGRPEIAMETIRRVIRGETHSEVGVGSSERVNVSNRLQGELRAPGDFAPAYHLAEPDGLAEQLAGLDALREASSEASSGLEEAPEDLIAKYARLTTPDVAPVDGKSLLDELTKGDDARDDARDENSGTS